MTRAVFGGAVMLVTFAVMAFSVWLAMLNLDGPAGFPRPGYTTVSLPGVRLPVAAVPGGYRPNFESIIAKAEGRP